MQDGSEEVFEPRSTAVDESQHELAVEPTESQFPELP
jgi:hypothetical protein